MQMVNESNAPAPLSMAVVPQSFLNGLMDEVREVKSLLQKKSEEEVNSQWIESTQVRKRLGISAKTWQTYRDERRIPFSQFGRKIYVKRADLEKFMEGLRCLFPKPEALLYPSLRPPFCRQESASAAPTPVRTVARLTESE